MFFPVIQDAALYERLHESCKQEVATTAGKAMTVAHLKSQERDSLQRPRFLVLCSPSGLPVDQLVQRLVTQHADSLGSILTCTSRRPMVSDRTHYPNTTLPLHHHKTFPLLTPLFASYACLYNVFQLHVGSFDPCHETAVSDFCC